MARAAEVAVIARGTKEWVKDPPLGHSWCLEYMVHCLGSSLAAAGFCEYYYRLGKAHAEFEEMERTQPIRSVIYG